MEVWKFKYDGAFKELSPSFFHVLFVSYHRRSYLNLSYVLPTSIIIRLLKVQVKGFWA